MPPGVNFISLSAPTYPVSVALFNIMCTVGRTGGNEPARPSGYSFCRGWVEYGDEFHSCDRVVFDVIRHLNRSWYRTSLKEFTQNGWRYHVDPNLTHEGSRRKVLGRDRIQIGNSGSLSRAPGCAKLRPKSLAKPVVVCRAGAWFRRLTSTDRPAGVSSEFSSAGRCVWLTGRRYKVSSFFR